MIPDRSTLVLSFLIALTPVAGVILARFVGQGVRPAAASSAFSIADLPDFPSATTTGRAAVDPAQVRSPFRIQSEPVVPAMILPEVGELPPKIEDVPEFVLTTVMPNAPRPLAVINGRARTLGDEAAPGWIVTDIDGNTRRVVLTGPDGRAVVLGMRSGMP
jgi:hypothetical protein